jgi:Ca2+-transporting ATPase
MADSTRALTDTAPSIPIYALPESDVYAALGSQPSGLSPAEAGLRLARHGRNTIREVKGKPLALRFLANFTHLMALLLWAGGLIGLLAHLPQLALAIWMVNVINGSFSFWQEYKAERATEALRRLLPHHALVLRDGEEVRLPAEELVPGDVLLLTEGEHISADARLVRGAELRVDQSTLTGESRAVRKSPEPVMQRRGAVAELPCLVFAGTSVVTGTGAAVVYATGMATEFGRIAHLTQSVTDEQSPLQLELRHVTRTVTLLATGVGAAFFLLAVTLVSVQPAEAFIFAMGMIVAFVPEGMLPTVTLTLAIGVQRMARRHALIKRLSAVETLGCTSVICTDKTGTLTKNEMTVTDLWTGNQAFTVTGAGYAPQGEIQRDGQRLGTPLPVELRRLLLAASLCNNARLTHDADAPERWVPLGDPTEAALRVVALKGGIEADGEEERTPRVYELPFDSHRKRMSTVHQTDTSLIAYVKGAPGELLAQCTSIRLDGAVCPLDAEWESRIRAHIDAYARGGLRVLAVAERTLPDPPPARTPDAVERELTFLGLVAMLDPPRPEAAEAVARCHRAGIRVLMITGDYGLTAESIARRIGILRNDRPRILTGAELDAMDETALRAALEGEVILARVDPEDKQRVVTALQRLGHVVAVTGDGVNDAPALKQANIGVAMGIAGTDVAQEAADMVLTDDNFASIVNAVEEGRAVYGNIRKFVTYIFTSNGTEAVPFVLYALSGGRIPLALTVMQVLSIDLGTDMVPAIALGAEPAEPGLMERPPRSLKAHIITRSLLARAFLLLAIAQSLATLAAFYFQYWTHGYAGQWLDLPGSGTLYRSATAMALAAVATTQVGNLFAQRTTHLRGVRIPLGGNPLIWVGIVSQLALVTAIIYLPPLQWIFGTAAFPAVNWVFLVACMPLLLVVDEVRKALARRRTRGTRGSPPIARAGHG